MLNQKTFPRTLIYSGALLFLLTFLFGAIGMQAQASRTTNLIAEASRFSVLIRLAMRISGAGNSNCTKRSRESNSAA